MAAKRKELQRLNGAYKNTLGNAKVTLVEGRGRVVDPHTVEASRRARGRGRTCRGGGRGLASGTRGCAVAYAGRCPSAPWYGRKEGAPSIPRGAATTGEQP